MKERFLLHAKPVCDVFVHVQTKWQAKVTDISQSTEKKRNDKNIYKSNGAGSENAMNT